ncbi:MAG: HNH endonuclease [Flavobacterium sp.]|nr:MAG: HNH endonuclease [Flavobacterium sp.]
MNTILTYSEMLLSERWKQKRQTILERDMRRCRNCGCNKNLHVHHRQYHTYGKTGIKKYPWEYATKYLVTLCESCHAAGHKQYQIPIFKN